MNNARDWIWDRNYDRTILFMIRCGADAVNLNKFIRVIHGFIIHTVFRLKSETRVASAICLIHKSVSAFIFVNNIGLLGWDNGSTVGNKRTW